MYTPRSRFSLSVLCLATLIAGCSGGESHKARYMEKGQAFLAAGNLKKARIEFRNALQISPNDVEARYDNGVVAEKLGDLREAVQFYQGAIDIDQDNDRARTALGRVYTLMRAPEQALETIKPSFDKHPDDPQLLTVRAVARGMLNDLPEALADAQKAVKLAPNDENALATLAGSYQANGQTDQAVALLEDAVKQMPQTISLRIELADLYVRRNQEGRAEALLVELIGLEPAQVEHRRRLAHYYARADRLDDAERVLREGIQALPDARDLKLALVDFLSQRRSREAAEKELRGFIAQAPKDNPLRFALADFYVQGEDYAKAEAVYHEVIDAVGLEGAGITARNHLAALRSQQNDISGAQKLLDEVLAKVPRDGDALFLRADLALRQKDPKTAITDLRLVLRDQPNAVNAMQALARAHLLNQEPDLAEETMRQAVEIDPTDATLRLELASLLMQRGKPDQARPVVDELIKQQPHNLDALAAQFGIASTSKDLVAAKAAADAMVATNPKLGVGYYFQGAVAESEHRVDDAVRLYAASVDREPTATEALQAMTRLLFGQNRVAEALKRLDDLAARYPDNDAVLNLKGELLIAQKRDVEAVAAFKAAVARAPASWAGYRNLAHAQMTDKHNDTAIATLQAGIAKVSNPEPLEAELGLLYQQSGKLDEAIQLYDTALRLNPQAEAVANNLAMLLVDTRRDPASIERAKQLTLRFQTSNNPELLDTYGWVQYKTGDVNAALAALESASNKALNTPDLWYHLGMAQLLAGQSQAARDSLTRSLKSGQSFYGIDEARATLDRLAAQKL